MTGGNHSVVLIGANNILLEDYGVASGKGNNITKDYARVHGLEGATDWLYEDVLSSGKFAVAGDAKISRLSCKGLSTSASYVQITMNAPEISEIVIPLNTTVAYKVTCVGANVDGTQQGMWTAQGIITRGTGDVVVKGNTVTKVYSDSATWDFLAAAYTPSQSLNLTAHGDAGQTVRWVATVELTVVKL